MRDLEEALQVPADRVFRWISRRGLPARKMGEQVWFGRNDVLDWAIGARQALRREFLGTGLDPDLLAAALEKGGRSAIVTAEPSAMVDHLADLSSEQRALAAAALRDPAIRFYCAADGIAVPSSRGVVLTAGPARVRVFDLADPLMLGGAKISHWCWIVAPTVVSHLQLVLQLASALRAAEFRQAIGSTEPWQRVVAVANDLKISEGS
ncbi:MAG: hypothetical protein KGR26_08465 [Cyanobacteria bacterium REEB65]|nr:hypothetical protein [Cyanobacteria bacterium REEB65]